MCTHSSLMATKYKRLFSDLFFTPFLYFYTSISIHLRKLTSDCTFPFRLLNYVFVISDVWLLVCLFVCSDLGAHILSGAVMQPTSLNELIPDWKEKEVIHLKWCNCIFYSSIFIFLPSRTWRKEKQDQIRNDCSTVSYFLSC